MEQEKILGIVQVARPKFGFITKTLYEDLCFTTNRLIVARTGSWGGGKWTVAAGGIGTMVEYFKAGTRSKELTEEFNKLSPGEILKANKDNFEIPYSTITKIELTKGLRYLVKVFQGSRKHQWYIDKDRETRYDHCVNLVRSVLPGKLSS